MVESPYKIAPTWLFNEVGKTELFNTQEEVDEAWDNGWFGPRNLLKTAPLLSTISWTKNGLKEMVGDDARYLGFKVNTNDGVQKITDALIEFEVANGVGETSVESEE